MQIKILGCESFGARSLACIVKTGERKILIDPGVALARLRYGLLPHLWSGSCPQGQGENSCGIGGYNRHSNQPLPWGPHAHESRRPLSIASGSSSRFKRGQVLVQRSRNISVLSLRRRKEFFRYLGHSLLLLRKVPVLKV